MFLTHTVLSANHENAGYPPASPPHSGSQRAGSLCACPPLRPEPGWAAGLPVTLMTELLLLLGALEGGWLHAGLQCAVGSAVCVGGSPPPADKLWPHGIHQAALLCPTCAASPPVLRPHLCCVPPVLCPTCAVSLSPWPASVFACCAGLSASLQAMGPSLDELFSGELVAFLPSPSPFPNLPRCDEVQMTCFSTVKTRSPGGTGFCLQLAHPAFVPLQTVPIPSRWPKALERCALHTWP